MVTDPNILTQEAIRLALSREWKEAIKVNLKLLKINSRDIDALNRLARSYFELGQKTNAQTIYQRVLRFDKFNTIAAKGLELLKTSRVSRSSVTGDTSSFPPPNFIEEPGVTKTIHLTRLGDPKITSRLHPGDPVLIVPRQHCVSIVTPNTQEYIGRLPDDLTSRLLPLLAAGNTYHAWIKSVSDGYKIFVREISRAAKYQNMPSFPLTEKLTYAAFTPPELIHSEKPDVSETEDQETYSTTDDTEAPEWEDQPRHTPEDM